MKHFLLSLSVCMAFFAGSVAGQEPERGPDADARTRVPGMILLSIPGKPFSGVDNIKWTRTLATEAPL